MAVILNPVSRPPQRERHPNPRPSSLAGKTIGVINNGHGNAGVILGRVTELLQERYPDATILMRQKPSLRNRAPAPIVDELTARADVVITGLGA